MQRVICVLAAGALLSGCATTGANYVPLVDMQGKDQSKFQTDLSDCQSYARQRMDAAQGAMVGAVAGALLGAFLAPRGSKGYVAGKTAGLGALGAGGEANNTQQGIIKTCLAGRGYNVLN